MPEQITPDEMVQMEGDNEQIATFCFIGTPTQLREWMKEVFPICAKMGIRQATAIEKARACCTIAGAYIEQEEGTTTGPPQEVAMPKPDAIEVTPDD